MRSHTRKAKIFTAIGSAILLATAVFHASGYPQIVRATSTASFSPFPVAAFRASWVLFSSYLFPIGILVLLFAFRPPPSSKAVLGVCSALLAMMLVVLLVYVGAFSGAILLGLGTIAVIAAAMLIEGEK